MKNMRFLEQWRGTNKHNNKESRTEQILQKVEKLMKFERLYSLLLVGKNASRKEIQEIPSHLRTSQLVQSFF